MTDFVIPEGSTDLTGDGGVYKKITKPGTGTGTPVSGDTVYVHYVGTLYGGVKNGEEFDSSRKRSDPFSFTLDNGQVIKGWDKVVGTMLQGETCEVFLKPEYAYGEGGSGSIPPNACLKFAIELLRWTGEDVTEEKNGGVHKSRLRNGEGYTSPKDGAVVDVVIKGSYGDTVFDQRSFKFEMGTYEEVDLCLGVEQALKKMNTGELARVTVNPNYGFGKTGHTGFKVPADAELVYEIELKDFEKLKEGWEMDVSEKLTQSDLAKTKGTDYFKKGKLKLALGHYKRCIDYLEWDTDFQKEPEEVQKQRIQLLLAARLNSALVNHKLGFNTESMNHCDEAIKLDTNSEKAYFRRGQAHFAMADYAMAISDYQNVMRIDPSNKAAAKEIHNCVQKAKEEKERQKSTYLGMFDKFATRDQKDNEHRLEAELVIDQWDNKLADGMLSIPQELEAFGEKMPEAKMDQRCMQACDDDEEDDE